MNIIVCIKQILDPEIPARDFRVDSAKREAERGSANLVTNIFCENALETALQFREAHGGKITALTCRARGGRRRAAQGAGAAGRRRGAGGQRRGRQSRSAVRRQGAGRRAFASSARSTW